MDQHPDPTCHTSFNGDLSTNALVHDPMLMGSVQRVPAPPPTKPRPPKAPPPANAATYATYAADAAYYAAAAGVNAV